MRRASIMLMTLFVLLAGSPSSPANSAIVFSVNNGLDAADTTPGDGVCASTLGSSICTLRAAIQEANALTGSDIIKLPSGTYTLTISGIDEDAAAQGDLDITDDLTIIGVGAAHTIIDGGDRDRVFHITGAITVEIAGVTIQNGRFPGIFPGGGGILNSGSRVKLTNSIISKNEAGLGGGIRNIGQGIVELANSTISMNVARFQGVLYTGGGIENWGTVKLMNSTISSNRASSGSGISNDSGTVKLINSTITWNDSTSGLAGSGISNSSGTVELTNTIVANNGEGKDCRGSIKSNGYNLDSDGTCDLNPALSDLPHTNPLLGSLRLNAPGNTETHALLPDSPAIDVIPLAKCGGLDATAVGSLTPPTGPDGTSVTNGDFLITDSGASSIVGNGIDETTTWTFDFATDPDTIPLKSALLILTLTPKNGLIINDALRIEGLPNINTALIQGLPLDQTKSIELELLDFYSSSDIMGIFAAPPARQLPLNYADDAIVSFARLVFNATDQRGIARPRGGACDIGAFERQEGETAITLLTFTAASGPSHITLAWQTGTETDNAGFNLWRRARADSKYIKLNETLIPAEGDPVSGASYTYLDTTIEPGQTYTYKLEDVDIQGISTFHELMSGEPVLMTTSDSYWLYLPLLPQ